jgi:hypothetical protein
VSESLVVTHAGVEENKDSEPSQGRSWGLEGLPAVMLPISSLLLDDSPRHAGESDEHVQVLTESEERLPPIVVHGPSMRVIDGRHRVRAAMIRGDVTVDAKIYHGTAGDAFVLAVRMNITHGLPLTRADRSAAALRIIGSHPQWSDRMIATATGLSAGTVAKARQRSTVSNAQSNTRVGKDGRARPSTMQRAGARPAICWPRSPPRRSARSPQRRGCPPPRCMMCASACAPVRTRSPSLRKSTDHRWCPSRRRSVLPEVY